MLGRLDSQLDSTSLQPTLPPQLTGEPMSLSSSSLPIHTRVPLSVVVSALVDSWSLAFLDLARSGDAPSMLLVAQMYLVDRGYGAIRHSREEGVRWLLRCVETDEGESREMCRRLCPKEYAAWLEERRRQAGGEARLRREQEQAMERQQADCAPSERSKMSNRAAAAASTTRT